MTKDAQRAKPTSDYAGISETETSYANNFAPTLSLSLSLLPNYGGTGDGDGGGPVAERRRRQRWRRQRGDGERPTRGEPSDGLTKGARRPNSSAAPPLARTLPVLYNKYITPATSSS